MGSNPVADKMQYFQRRITDNSSAEPRRVDAAGGRNGIQKK